MRFILVLLCVLFLFSAPAWSGGCPDISIVKKYTLRTESRKDGVYVPSTEPVVLTVPVSYLSPLPGLLHDADNTSDEVAESMKITADYYTLQPFCLVQKASFPANTHHEQFTLFVDRFTGSKKDYFDR